MFDLDLRPMSLTFNPILAGVKVNLHAKYQGRRSKDLAVRALADSQTKRQTNVEYNKIKINKEEV